MEAGSTDDHRSVCIQPSHHRSVGGGGFDQERGSGGGDEPLLIDKVLEGHRDAGQGSRVRPGGYRMVDGLGPGKGPIRIESRKGIQVVRRLDALEGGGDGGYGRCRARSDVPGDSNRVHYSQVTVL